MADDKRYTGELDEINKLLENIPEQPRESADLEDILYEFGSRLGRPGAPASFLPNDAVMDASTLKMKGLAEEMRRLTALEDADAAQPSADPQMDTVVLPRAHGEQVAPEDFESTKPLPCSEYEGLDPDDFLPPPPELFGPPLTHPDMVTHEDVFGSPEDFDRAFAPAGDFAPEMPFPSDEDEEDDGKPPRKSLRLVVAEFIRSRRRPIARPAMTPQEAQARLAPYVRSLTIRCIIALVICLPLLYITFAPLLQWPLPDFWAYTRRPYAYLLYVGVSLLFVMFCAIDMLALGLQDILRLHPGQESLLLISCVASLLHVISLIALDGWIGFLPFCACNALGVLISLWGHRQQMEACRRGYQIAAASSNPMLMYREDHVWNGHDAFTKGEGTTDDFVERTEAPDLARRFAVFFAPLTLAACIVAAVLSSVGQGRGAYFFWAFSAITCVSSPFVASLVFSLPFVRVARRLASSGAALSGWTAARMFTENAVVVAADADLFPAGAISLEGLKVFGSFGFDRVVGSAASLISMSGSGLLPVFSELLQNDLRSLRHAEHFQHYEGGFGGEIGGDRILLGGANFIISMGVTLAKEFKIKNAVFVTINSELAGIFVINYTGVKSVTHSLDTLARQKIPLLLAVRDFNITDKLVCARYKSADEALLHYPTVEDRLALSESSRDPFSRPVAVVVRDGLEPFAECVAGGTRLRKVARINLILYCVSAVLGLLLSFYLTFVAAASTLSPSNVTLFLLLWCLPVSLISGLADRY